MSKEEKYDLLKELEKAADKKDSTVWDYKNKYLGHPLFKKKECSQVWWVSNPESDGILIFTIDKEKYFYLYRDYNKLNLQ